MPKTTPGDSPFRFVARIYGAWPWMTGAICAVTLVGHAATALQPALIRHLTDAVVAGKGIPTALALTLASTWAVWSCWRALNALDTELAFRASHAFQKGSAAKLLAQSSEFFGEEFTGSIIKRASQMTGVVQQAPRYLLYDLSGIFIKTAVVGATLALRDVRLGLVFAAWFACVAGGITLFLRKVGPLRKESIRLETEAAGRFADAVGGVPTVTQFGTHGSEADAVTESWQKSVVQRVRLSRWRDAFIGWLSFVGCANMTALVAWAALYGHGAGDVAMAVMLGGMMLDLAFSSRTIQQGQEYDAQAREYLAMAGKPVTVEDTPGAPEFRPGKGSLELRGVTFRYGDKAPVLENFSLSVRPGEKVALVGPSGAGKSTVTRLLLRLWDTREGSVLVDGQDVRGVTRASLRAGLAYVPQDPVLFHRTIAENIAYGRPDATRAQIEAAAKIAHCHEFVAALPRGYDTLVGERGVKLSGGERQRVAIARAVLKDARILVLDEPTSALDSQSEAYIQDGLEKAMEGRTTVVVAHRLSTVMRADRVVVMDHGRIVEEGPHAALAAKPGGLYAKLWSLQSGGYLQDAAA